MDLPMLRYLGLGTVQQEIFFGTHHFSENAVYNFSVPYKNRKENPAPKLADEFSMKWRLTRKPPLQLLKLILHPHDRLLEGHLRLNKCSTDLPGGESHLQCLRPDSQ